MGSDPIDPVDPSGKHPLGSLADQRRIADHVYTQFFHQVHLGVGGIGLAGDDGTGDQGE